MKKFSKLICIVLCLVLAVSMTGCGAKDNEKIVIGYSVQSMENAYFVSVIDGMKKAAEELGIELVISDAAADASKHIDHIENFSAQEVDAIIISPVDEEAPRNAVENVVKEGIPVISFTQLVKGSSAFYGLEEYDFGYSGGSIAGDWLNEKEADGTIDEILNDEGEIEVCVIRYDVVASLIARGDGLKDGLTETYTGDKPIKFVLEQDAADASNGMKVAETALTSNPDTCIVLGINDSSALGAYEAFAADSSKNADNSCITGLDCLPEAVVKIAGNTIFKGTVDIDPVAQGRRVLEICLEVIENGPIADKEISKLKRVDKKNIGEYIK